ncbi:hypothetical protein L810_6251 [Burkholderia sp. AU4i]|nr:hypothetical protein L810_6251 [Burkholderia sp. AU4i]
MDPLGAGDGGGAGVRRGARRGRIVVPDTLVRPSGRLHV